MYKDHLPSQERSYKSQLPGELLFESSITAMMLVDDNRIILVVNRQFCALFGYTAEEVIGKSTSILTPTMKHFFKYRKYFVETRDGSIKSSELQYKKKNGELVWVKLTGTAIVDEKERYILWSFDDISEEVESRQELHDLNLELNIIFNKVPTGLVYVVDNVIERANSVFLTMINKEEDEVVGKNIHTLLPDARFNKDGQKKILVQLRRADKTLTVEQEISPITENSAIVLFHNITGHILEKAELLNRAMTDGLTGILNKDSFQKRVQALLDDPANDVVSLAIFDIDHFKNVNDTYGHIVGDKILVELSELLNRQVRKSEILGRIGGEEFGIAFPVEKKDGIPICDRLLQSIRNQYFIDSELRITVSMGLTDSNFSRHFNEMYKEADRLMYCAKKSGWNRLEFDCEEKMTDSKYYRNVGKQERQKG